MKNVLMIAYSFPPAGGPGVQRSSKFVKYLYGHGWKPVVLTRDDKNMSLRDKSLLKDIPDNTIIIRTKAWDLTMGKGFMGLIGKFISRKILIPDSEILWGIFSKKGIKKIISEHDIKLIYTTSLPYSSHLMALFLKKVYPDIPWVADFRDEWTNNPYILDNPYNLIRTRIEKKMEKSVLKNADCLITNTPVMLRNFIKNNKDIADLEDKFFVIPNGYDAEDFSFYRMNDINKNIKNTRFIITYTGSFYGRRKPDLFFKALGELILENRIDKNKILVKLIGNFKKEHMEPFLNKNNLKEIIHILPYMEHDQCILNMAASDCLLLIEGAGPGAEAFYTGKIFEYMVAGRPILAIIPQNGAAAQLIKETNTGLISDCSDISTTKNNIEALYSSWQNNINIYTPNMKEIEKYERNTLARKLAKVFDKALFLKSH
jgi:glycosyltransferase involved in cell wall biosynthesis